MFSLKSGLDGGEQTLIENIIEDESGIEIYDKFAKHLNFVPSASVKYKMFEKD